MVTSRYHSMQDKSVTKNFRVNGLQAKRWVRGSDSLASDGKWNI